MTQPEHQPFEYATYWLIPSRTDTDSNYLVHVAGNNGYGCCPCTWGRSEIDIAFREGRQPKRSCYHIEEAHRRFHAWCLWEFESRNPNAAHDKTIQR